MSNFLPVVAEWKALPVFRVDEYFYPSKIRELNVAGFIARRIAGSGGEKRMSRPIVMIAMAGIALGIAVMLLAVSIVKGFQLEVRDLVIGFGSHIQIVENADNYSKESERVEIDQPFYPSLAEKPGIRHIQQFATKAGILETTEHIQGVVIKGIATDFDWSFFGDRLIRGSRLELNDSVRSTDILISDYLARRLDLDTNSRVTLYFIRGKEDITPRNFVVKGVYHTGLEEFDQKYVFVDIAHIQKLSNWGLQAQALVDSCRNGTTTIEALGYGGDGRLDFEWPETGWTGPGPHELCVSGDTLITVVVTDRSETVPDTAFVEIRSAEASGSCDCTGFSSHVSTSGGSERYYTGGFEVLLDSYEGLAQADELVMYEIPYYLKTVNIREQSPEIFSWLEVLDLNVIVIIVLMILVSVINMASALLILILERTSMIGTLKAFGITEAQVVRIFLYHAALIIGRGMLIGNGIALLLGFGQMKFGFMKLDASQYYLSQVPILFSWYDFLLLNLGTLVISLLLLIVPALYVTTISPAKAIRFD